MEKSLVMLIRKHLSKSEGGKKEANIYVDMDSRGGRLQGSTN